MAVLIAVVRKVRSEVHLAQKALLASESEMFPLSACNYTFSASPGHLPIVTEELSAVTFTSKAGLEVGVGMGAGLSAF